MVYGYLIWAVGAIVVALGLLALVRMRRRKFRSPDQLQALGMTLVVLGIVFGQDPLFGYSFLITGILIMVVGLVIRRRIRRA